MFVIKTTLRAVIVHKFNLTGAFRILSERRSRTGFSVVGSDGTGNGSDLTVSSHSCSDSLGGMAVVDD